MLTGYIAREDETPITHTLPRSTWERIVASLRDIEGYVRLNHGNAPQDVAHIRWCIESMLYLHDHKAETAATHSS